MSAPIEVYATLSLDTSAHVAATKKVLRAIKRLQKATRELNRTPVIAQVQP